MASRKGVDAPGNGVEHGFRLVLVGRMPAVLELEQLDVAHFCTDAPHLLHRSVLVVLALDREHRARYAREVLLDVPRAEIGMEPDPVPAPEYPVDVGVMARKLRQKACRFLLGLA